MDGVPPPKNTLVTGGQAGIDGTADLGPQRGEVVADQVLPVGPGGEGAVVAADGAERDVDVGAEGGARPRRPRRSLLGGVRVEPQAPGVQLAHRLVDREVEHGGHGPHVVGPDGQHLAVEVATGVLDHLEVAGQHLEVGPVQLGQPAQVDGHLLARRRRGWTAGRRRRRPDRAAAGRPAPRR